jgi:glycosyltransferase involved in cell wall biosynthesis
MSDVVFYSGRHLITTGATRSVADSILRHQGSYDVTLIGMGLGAAGIRSQVAQYDLQGLYGKCSLPIRALQKLQRSGILGDNRGLVLNNYLNSRLDVLADFLNARQLKALLAGGERPRVFISWNSMSLTSGRFAKRHGIAYVIHSQWSHPAVQAAKLGDEYRRLGHDSPPLSKARLARQVEEFEAADFIWCASQLVVDSLVDNGVSAQKIIKAPLGVDLERFKPSETDPTTESRFTILMVGTVIIRKGPHLLLEAVLRSSIRDATVVLNGPADALTRPIIEDYRARLAERGVEVSIEPGDPRKNLERASVFVLASVEEAFGLVVLEAMASALPVIVSSEVGAKECIEHGGNGFVFDSGDVDSLARHLEQLYGDRQQGIDLGKRSLELVQRYDVRSTSRELMETVLERASAAATG